jgi:hypothetical protein
MMAVGSASNPAKDTFVGRVKQPNSIYARPIWTCKSDMRLVMKSRLPEKFYDHAGWLPRRRSGNSQLPVPQFHRPAEWLAVHFNQ